MYSKSEGLTPNSKKTKVNIFSHRPIDQKFDFFMDGNRLEVVTKDSYLGFPISNDLSLETAIGTAVSRGNSALNALIANKIKIPRLTLENINLLFTSKIESTILAGSELWGLSPPNHLERLDSVMHSFYKRCRAIPQTASNLSVRMAFGLFPTTLKTRINCLKFVASLTKCGNPLVQDAVLFMQHSSPREGMVNIVNNATDFLVSYSISDLYFFREPQISENFHDHIFDCNRDDTSSDFHGKYDNAYPAARNTKFGCARTFDSFPPDLRNTALQVITNSLVKPITIFTRKIKHIRCIYCLSNINTKDIIDHICNFCPNIIGHDINRIFSENLIIAKETPLAEI